MPIAKRVGMHTIDFGAGAVSWPAGLAVADRSRPPQMMRGIAIASASCGRTKEKSEWKSKNNFAS